jgi:hypothetical protein
MDFCRKVKREQDADERPRFFAGGWGWEKSNPPIEGFRVGGELYR